MSEPQQKKPFVPPRVGLGDTLLWRHAKGDADPAAAIVVKVGSTGALGLVVFAPDTARPMAFDGVLHEDDPRNQARESDSGVWGLTDRDARTRMILSLLHEGLEDLTDSDTSFLAIKQLLD